MSRGVVTAGDAIRNTVDGVDTSALWTEFQETMRLRNEARDNLTALLTFKTTAVGEKIAQTINADDFEEASEFGVPKTLRPGHNVLTLAYGFRWFDAATRFTWRALVDMDASQVEAINAAALEADNRLVFKAMMGALLNPAPRQNPEGMTILGLYNADGTVPPENDGTAFTGTHTHYLVSGAATLDGNDLLETARHLTHHGYGDVSRGGRVVIFMHPNEAEVARGLVRGPTSNADFIPSESAPAYLTDKALVGDRAPATLGRIPIIGSIGSAWLSENSLIPAGYVLAVAVNGANDARNVLGLREHVRPELQGLRLLGGPNETYPLTSAYYQRGMGTGVRQRGGAAVMQIKAAGTYDVPAAYASVLA